LFFRKLLYFHALEQGKLITRLGECLKNNTVGVDKYVTMPFLSLSVLEEASQGNHPRDCGAENPDVWNW
jgi:hypothetical protein